MTARSSRLRFLIVLCWATATACAPPAPPSAVDEADAGLPGDVVEAEPEPEPKAWSPYTVEEARAVRDSFRWEDTVALPEEPLAQRTPGAMEKAALDPISQIISSMVSLYYVQIYVNNSDQLRELDEMFIHWDMAPLFEEELPAGDFTMTFEGDPKDKGGMFVYAFMPGITYNLIRTAALFGEETYKAMPMRTVPLPARAWDGSVKWEYLAGTLLSYAPPRTHLTDAGETPFPSVLDAEIVDGAQQKRLGRRLRKWARKARDTARTVVDTVRKGVGELAKAFRPETKLTILTKVTNHDPSFTGGLIRAWDRYGSAATFRNELRLQNTRVNVTQLGGISLFVTKTDESGAASVSVPTDRKTRICVEADSPAARMEAGLLWPFRSCVNAGTVKGKTQGIGIILPEDEFAALAQLQDARDFSSRALGQKPSKATVQVGWPASLITAFNSGRAFVPCLEATKGPVSVANVLYDALEAVLPASGNVIEFLITSDIILPKDGRRDRVTPSHEYGHFLLCDLLNRENAQTFNYVWSAVIKDTLPSQKNTEVTRINEGFADWFASQVTGGVGYFELDPRLGRLSSNGRFFDFQATGQGLGMEENVGSRNCIIQGPIISSDTIPFTWPGCQHTVLTGLDQGIATFATLMHDVIDRNAPQNELTGDAAVWRFTQSPDPNVKPAYVLKAGPWQATSDEAIEMPAKSLINGFRDFAKRNGVVGTRLTLNNLLYAITSRLIYVHKYSRDQVCKLIKLHEESGQCSTSVVPDENPPVIGVF